MGAFKNPLSLTNQMVDKPGGPIGRDDQGGDGNPAQDGTPLKHCSPRKAGVVIRATVEHIDLVGDTELTVNVKWPASTFCVQPCGKPAASTGPTQDSSHVPENGPLANVGTLYGESVAGSEQEVKSSPSEKRSEEERKEEKRD
jgi:hypothetical protein